MSKKTQTLIRGLRNQRKGGGETSTIFYRTNTYIFVMGLVLFFSPGHCHPHHTPDSALRKFDFLLNKVQTLWIVLVRFFISLLGQRHTMFRD